MNDSINPAWQPLLNKIPAEFHPLIIPDLKEWDKGVQQKFTEIRSEFDDLKSYEKFVKNGIDAEYAEQAVILANRLQDDPSGLVSQINEAWELGYVSKDEAAKLAQSSAGNGTEDQDFYDTENDIFKDPRVKAMKEALDTMQTEFKTKQEREEEEAALQEFESYIETLEKQTTEKNLPFNKTFVTALISQGVDGEAAVEQFHQMLGAKAVEDYEAQNQDKSNDGKTVEPPVVMGGEGSTGGGTPDGSVDFGKLSKNDLNATIEQMLAQQAQSGQG